MSTPTTPRATPLLERRLALVEERYTSLQTQLAEVKESNAALASTQRVLRADMNSLTSQMKASSAPQVAPAASMPAPPSSAISDAEKAMTINVEPLWQGGPTEVHVFSSGVKVWQHYLRKAQRERFLVKNLWEQLDEPLITKVLQHAEKGDVFIDCGAALGYYSLLARRISPDIEIHSFNPHPKFVERMRNNMKLNGVSDINIHQLAIADKAMHGIKITSAGFGGRIQPNKEGTINTTTLNDFLPTISGWKRILLVKADVEGFELKMLEAATNLYGVVKNWVIAIHQTRKQCGELLKKVGYDVIAEDPVRVEGEPNGVLVATLDKETFFPEFEKDSDS
uniref:Methyltransferase FkbM domain-containing protein n=1 Tax=Eutreptiella gymnastica TaxID=73025 RepID=A0A7S1I840_9EUGL